MLQVFLHRQWYQHLHCFMPKEKSFRPYINISYLGKIPKIPKTNTPKTTNLKKLIYATVCIWKDQCMNKREDVEKHIILSKISIHKKKCKIIIKNHCTFEQLKIIFKIFLLHFPRENKEKIQVVKWKFVQQQLHPRLTIGGTSLELKKKIHITNQAIVGKCLVEFMVMAIALEWWEADSLFKIIKHYCSSKYLKIEITLGNIVDKKNRTISLLMEKIPLKIGTHTKTALAVVTFPRDKMPLTYTLTCQLWFYSSKDH